MLNWRIEEEQEIKQAIDKYYEEQSKMPLGFMISKKANDKNIRYVTKKAIERYRYRKLEEYQLEIEEERKRIDKVVEDINDKFNNYLKTIKGNINKEIKPFKIEVKEYNGLNPTNITPTEIVKISCEPFQIAFIQEKIKK